MRSFSGVVEAPRVECYAFVRRYCVTVLMRTVVNARGDVPRFDRSASRRRHIDEADLTRGIVNQPASDLQLTYRQAAAVSIDNPKN